MKGPGNCWSSGPAPLALSPVGGGCTVLHGLAEPPGFALFLASLWQVVDANSIGSFPCPLASLAFNSQGFVHYSVPFLCCLGSDCFVFWLFPNKITFST